jgi:hypothetical protein
VFFSRKLSGAQSKYTVTKLELLAIVETLKEFNGMLWGQRIIVYTDHKNLTRDGLGLTSDRVTRWRIILEEYAPEIIYINGIHNTVADAISRLDYDPKLNTTNEYNHATHVVMSTKVEGSQKWMMVTKYWSRYNAKQGDTNECNTIQLNQCFANRNDEDKIYPLIVKEIVEAQKADNTLKQFFKRNAVQDKVELQLVENNSCICDKGRLVIPKPLQRHKTMWYHHYLQHPGHTHLKETMKTVTYWKGMRNTIQSITKSCKACQVNKKRTHKSMDISHPK